MKALNISKSFLLGVALLVGTSALAAEKGPLKIFDPLTVAGKQLKPGSYTVQWDGSGPNVALSILNGKSVVATTPARLVEMDRPAMQDATRTRSNADGSVSLAGVQFHGKKYALEIAGEPSQTAAASDTK